MQCSKDPRLRSRSARQLARSLLAPPQSSRVQLEREFPDYAALAIPKPLKPEDVPQLLDLSRLSTIMQRTGARDGSSIGLKPGRSAIRSAPLTAASEIVAL
jgi:hypothetical protein